MNRYLRQSTASQTRAIGPFIDDTDFKTAETALSIANTDIKVSKNGGTQASKNSGGATALASNGMYAVTWDATDTDTVGELSISVAKSGALLYVATYTVLEEAVYDALFAASAPGYLQPTTAGRTLDVSSGGEAGIDWANVGSPTTTVTLSGTTVKTATDVETDTQDIQSRLPAALVSGRMSSDVIAISGDSTAADNAEAFFDGTGYAGTNNVIPTVTTVTTTTNVTTVNGLAANVITAASIASDAITSAKVADGFLTAAKFASGAYDAVWSVSTRTLTAATNLTTDIATAVWSAATRVLTAGTNIVLAKGTGITGFNDPTAGAIADQVWEEAIADHSGAAGSTAEALNAAGSAGDPWTTALPGSYSAGQAGKIIGDNLNATVSSRASQTSVDTIDDFLDTEVAAIKAKTDNLPASPAATGDIPTAAAIRAEIDSNSTKLDAAVSTRATPAQVNAEVLDVLNVDTFAEPGQGAPAATATLATKIGYLFKAWRNKKTQTSTTTSLFADDGTTVDQKQTVSDDGTTFTSGEVASGP